MLNQSYTTQQIDLLMKHYPCLKNKAEEKYAKYKSLDPFPQVGEALLNSVDLLMYLLTVGIVEPFDEKKLKGITYQCTFSGEAHRFDPETGGMKEINLVDEEELVLEKNSITYLKIDEKFHVPDYMVLRFNLSVSNAYKGLLLGTGPIVDPGFEGNLFIPLHNLTGNEYIIKKGAPLIRVEFTKLSFHADWGNRRVRFFPGLNPITKKTPLNASFSSFIEDALLDPGKKQFYTKGDVVSVRSSIPDAIADSAKKAEEAQKSANTAMNEAKKGANTIRNWSAIGLISVAIALATILITSFSLIQDANARYDGIVQELEACKQQIRALTDQPETTREQLEQSEMVQPIDSGQTITADISGKLGYLPSLPSSKVGGDNGS